ncbi:unnamed protein product [Zymoseptoria tritici ST99CH_1A5]|uniref:F-box domain-containing protein n=1 Tax=Zymoseptoria tritici ST99CH_1A5 TaxID=1276529 RepID=A0A1Y6LQ11_ZYMTR|nr:unnamed protein product [Zymoseptoria tritici ST99CH_1A5]
MTECYFTSRLPAELRLRVYEFVLSFEAPLKLRQVVAGSKNTGILRCSRLTHREALPILYDRNTILLTRNDFCRHISGELSTPMRADKIRHLLINNFSTSIKCSSLSGGNGIFLDGCCEVCQPSGAGFISTLASLPQMRSVVIDYSRHPSDFRYIKKAMHLNRIPEGEHSFRLVCVGMARYRLLSPMFPAGLSIEYVNRPVNTIWNEILAVGSKLTTSGFDGEDVLLNRLRNDVHREIPDKLYLLYCARLSAFWPDAFPRTAKLWQDVENAIASSGDASDEMEALTEDIREFMLQLSPEDARSQLRSLREEEGRNLTLLP